MPRMYLCSSFLLTQPEYSLLSYSDPYAAETIC